MYRQSRPGRLWGRVASPGSVAVELSGGFRRTTNNRMELMGPIEGLESLKQSCRVTLHSDSQYVVRAMEKGWAKRWRGNGWMRNKREQAVSPDLWEKLLDLCEKHEVDFRWVRGHAGDPENERCDQLAVKAAHGKDLPADEGYETPLVVQPRL